MRKGLFSKNGLCKIIVTSAVFALAAVTVPSHISSLSVVHADSETANRSVSIQEIDTNNSTDDSESDSTENGTQNDNSDSNAATDTTNTKATGNDKNTEKNSSTKKKKDSAKNSSKKTAKQTKTTVRKPDAKGKKEKQHKEPKHFKPIIGKTVTVTMEHMQKKLNKISSDIKKTKHKEYRTKRVLSSKKRQLSSINKLKTGAKEQKNCITVSNVFEPSQSLKTYAKQYDSSLSIYLTQEVSSSDTVKTTSGSSILPDFKKMSSLMDTESIKHTITHSKKYIKSDIVKNKAKIKNIHKKIKSQTKEQKTAAKYVTVSINTKNIFEPSNISTKTLKKALEGTNLEELAPAFVKAEKKYGINAIAMTSIAALESGWGKSKRAVKDNNLTGLVVYSDTAKGINADTKEKNILMTAERLSTHYSRPGQMFYHGTGFDGVNKKYSASKTWGWKCENIAFRIMNKIANPGLESLSTM